MKKSIFTLFISVISIATFAINMVSTETKPFKLSIDHDSVRAYNGPETLTYSPFWSEEEGETAEITQNSETFLSKQTHEGDVVWQTSQDGVHYFEHKIRNASGEIIETETAAFAKNVGTEFYTVRFNANQGIGNMPNQIFAVNEAKALSKNTFTREGYKFVGWEKRSEYLVVDLSGGTSAASYPVTTLSEVPAGGWTDEYKTTKLVLRKITAGKMPRTDVDITLTKDYYIGVFEVTQRQWELVMGSNPSNFDGNTLPVEKVTYEDIRGTNDGSQWPASNAVDATSFMGKLRAKTGIDFDLPTEAQWEYACRAGSSGDWGLLADGTMGTLDAMGWYGGNSSSKTHLVGTKTPNAWGLYDMHGNVWEWCLDWDSSSGYSGSDPVGGTSGDCRVLHSGSWYYNDAYFCESSYRNSNNPDIRLNSYGLRVAAPAGINIAQTYEVTFNANGGEGTMPSQTFTHGVEQALSANAFTREGHTFAGWATSADGAVAYTAGESISVTAPMTLYAVWKANTYEVNFNANGGEGTMSSQTFTHGVAQAIKANAFTREGYTFAGWATSADGTIAYTAGESISITAPMTLYAVWKAKTYTVTFKPNGGEGTMSSQTFTHGVAQTIKANAFTREGRTFAGWATSADGTVAYTAGQSISITAPMTLYAVWKTNTYAVNFNANGGKGTMPAQTFTHGVAQAIKANAFTREGYTFAGWATRADGTVAYTAGQSISISAPMTLYAVWKANTYEVNFNANGGEGTMSFQTFTHGVAQAIKANAFTRDGYTFAGWATSADGTIAYTAGQSISITAPMTLYAVWKAITYEVNFNANGGEGTMPAQTFTHGVEQALSANTFTRKGYTFAGWATSADGTIAYTAGESISISAPQTLYAVWKANTYEVNFNANGGKGTMSSQTFTYGVAQAIKANAFTREGYIFAGWATSADGVVAYTAGESISISAPMTLYAVWDTPCYIVVDLSRAARYSVTTLSDVPVGGWTDEYKTTKLVLRKITAGKMPRTDIDLTLTKDYYVGVFEVTQTQWELVMGSNPSSFYGDTSPVEQVSYNDIRGSSNGSQWPASNAVDATSFMGKLRAKTGIDFDLPTEAQWEYACRAGSTGDWGLLANGTMGTLYAMGWYFDRNSIRRTHTVGAITPNAWGLYDMHGNVYEWCLDWYSSSGYSGTDPVGATSGNRRVKRGGSWKSEDYSCGSSDRSYNYPDLEDNYSGLRIAAPAGL